MYSYTFTKDNNRAKSEWHMHVDAANCDKHDWIMQNYPNATLGCMFPEISSLLEIYSAKRIVIIRKGAKVVVFFDKQGNVHVRYKQDNVR